MGHGTKIIVHDNIGITNIVTLDLSLIRGVTETYNIAIP